MVDYTQRFGKLHREKSVKPSEVVRSQIVTYAMELIDTPYKYNSVEPYKGSNCAEFGITPYKRAKLIDKGVRIPITHKDFAMGKDVDPNAFRDFILQFSEEISYDKRQSGDLVTFTYNGIESHVAIITQTNPDWIIHNPSGGAVRFQKLCKIPTLKSVYRHKSIIEMESLENGRSE